MLGLKLPTDPRWVNLAEKSIPEILNDHAYCEQKAASSCISLIVLFPDKLKLVETLTPMVAEEWGHFQRVLKEMNKRGIALGHTKPDRYVIELLKNEKKGGSKQDQLMEKLLFNALIEARSCERFRLLSKEISDDHLKKFYYELMVSEAGHYRNFIDLAEEYCDKNKVRKRWDELLSIEASILSSLDLRGDLMH